MDRFGEAPSYSDHAVLRASVACLLASIPQAMLGVVSLETRDVAWALLVLAVGLFLVGVLLLVRHFEARDGMTDLAPRTRLYDVRHERVAYLSGLLVTGSSVLVNVWFLVEGAALHLLPLFPTVFGAWLFHRLRSR